MPTDHFLRTSTRAQDYRKGNSSRKRHSRYASRTSRALTSDNIRVGRKKKHSNLLPLLYSYSGLDWVNWKYLAMVVSGARGLGELPGTRIQNIGEPCGWHERKQARRRGTNAKEEARFLRGERIDPTARSTLTATHSPGTSQPRGILRLYIATLLLIANRK